LFKDKIQVIDDNIYETNEEDSIDGSAFGGNDSSDLEDPFKTDEEDNINESAIDNDNSSGWQYSIKNGKSSIDDKTFQRVDSRPNLASRRSLITTMLHQQDRAAALANAASKSMGPPLAASPDSDDGTPLKQGIKLDQNIPRSASQPVFTITTNVTSHQAASSPKTTRRNMLQTELTASLRRHLLWERQQKNQTATAVLKQRHTAHKVANVEQYSERVHMETDDRDNYGSWNQYLSYGTGDYNSKGW
jgi:hypothetical protein